MVNKKTVADKVASDDIVADEAAADVMVAGSIAADKMIANKVDADTMIADKSVANNVAAVADKQHGQRQKSRCAYGTTGGFLVVKGHILGCPPPILASLWRSHCQTAFPSGDNANWQVW